ERADAHLCRGISFDGRLSLLQPRRSADRRQPRGPVLSCGTRVRGGDGPRFSRRTSATFPPRRLRAGVDGRLCRLAQVIRAQGMHQRFPRHWIVPESCRKRRPSNDEGAGNAGRQPHPRPCVRMEEAHKQVTTGQPLSPAFPARWLTTYSVFSPVRPGFVVTVAPRKIREVWHLHRGARTTRLRRPRTNAARRATQSASTASRLAFVTTRPPLILSRDGSR